MTNDNTGSLIGGLITAGVGLLAIKYTADIFSRIQAQQQKQTGGNKQIQYHYPQPNLSALYPKMKPMKPLKFY